VAFELFAAVGTAFAVERENEFDALCATTIPLGASVSSAIWRRIIDNLAEYD